ncbi:IMP cyclohydrolase [Candidatus Saccharibacteria bacterium]|nr:IMP cyclohydrolase [Candidatus Saccharibacteria bacterium]
MSRREQIVRTNFEALAANSYPGRGIIIGRTAANQIVQVYWVMGRSENSRNRILERDGDVVRTAPFDPAKVEDPSLIIYNAMAQESRQHVVSNGDQTDTVIDYLRDGSEATLIHPALKTRTYEPDAPNYTPRITGATNAYTGRSIMWLTRRLPYGETQHSYHLDFFDIKSVGRCLHTYLGDGDPLPSFKARPYLVPVGEGGEDTAQMYWDHLNSDNRVALVAKTIGINEDKTVNYHIINKHKT